MNYIQEQFLPYKESLELKKLGFNEECFFIRIKEDPFNLYNCSDYEDFPENKDKEIGTPLYQQAFDWFLEKHDLNGWVDCNKEENWIWTINFVKYGDYIQSDDHIEDLENLPEFYNTKKEAQLACIQQLIKLVKEKQ